MVDVHRELDSLVYQRCLRWAWKTWREERDGEKKKEQNMEAKTFSPGLGRQREDQG